MTKLVSKQVYTRIPTQVNQNDFKQFFLPYLSIPKWGPKCKIGYWKVFNLILKILYTGIQWKELGMVQKKPFWGNT